MTGILVTVQKKNAFPADKCFLLISFKLSCGVHCMITGFIILKQNYPTEQHPGATHVSTVALDKKIHLVAKFQLQLWSLNEITS